MKNKKVLPGLAAGAMIASGVLGVLSPTQNTYAAGGASAFKDASFKTCVLHAYNTENPTDLVENFSDLTDAKLATIKAVRCANGQTQDYDIRDISGIEYLTNLETLDLEGNSNLEVNISSPKFSIKNNAKLEDLNIMRVAATSDSIDISGNKELTTFRASNHFNLQTSAYAKKSTTGDGYTMDVSEVKILDKEGADYVMEAAEGISISNKIISFTEKPALAGVKFESNGGTAYFNSVSILPLPSTVRIEVITEDKTVAKTSESYFEGDTIDTDEILKEIIAGDEEIASELKDLTLNSVAVSKGVTLSKEDKASKVGTVNIHNGEISIVYVYGEAAPEVPDTGAFTSDGKTIIATASAAVLAVAGIALYVSRYAKNRVASRVRFGKK